jgi:hypothetical protein
MPRAFRAKKTKEPNSVALVRKRTIPTELPPLRRSYCQLLLVEGVAWSAQRIPTAVNLGFLDRNSDVGRLRKQFTVYKHFDNKIWNTKTLIPLQVVLKH